MSLVIVIPARMGSTRFPGKPLCDLMGKPMVQWVVEAALAAQVADRVVVATPDREIVEACAAFGAEAVMTSHECQTGTDRVAEVAKVLAADCYLNVQGDEPLLPPATIAACAKPLLSDPSVQMSSVYGVCAEEELDNPMVVKVVTDLDGYALYFSRYPIPYPRNPRVEPVKKHVGVYGFRRRALEHFAQWPMSALETAESLEQLRFLEHGIRIKMEPGGGSELAVDTPEQADEVRRILASRG